jgi:uncharacterized protein (TIGR02598 family)
MNSRPRSSTPGTRRSPAGGFSLIGVAAFCLVAILGLFPVGLKSVKDTSDQTAAAGYLDSVALDLRSIPLGSNTTPLYGITLLSPGGSSTFYFNEDGSTTNTNTSITARYAVQLTFTNPSALVTIAQIQIYWPPTAAVTNAQGLLESVITINRQ